MVNFKKVPAYEASEERHKVWVLADSCNGWRYILETKPLQENQCHNTIGGLEMAIHNLTLDELPMAAEHVSISSQL